MATAQKLPTLLNGVAVDGLCATIEAVKTTPSIAKFKFRVSNRWETGSRNRSTVASFSGTNQELTHAKELIQSVMEEMRKQHSAN